jgi:hypothetical protein
MSGGKGRRIETTVTGPLFAPVASFFGMLDDDTAIVEMAAAAGLPMLSREERNPEKTTSIGVGELILKAAESGAKKIVIGLGGSATNDCGLGMAQTLGYRFLDKDGLELSPVGGSLAKVAKIVPPASKMIPDSIVIEAACDVNNPLYGKNGAAYIFGPQKGADPVMVEALDQGLRNMADRIEADLGWMSAASPVAVLPAAWEPVLSRSWADRFARASSCCWTRSTSMRWSVKRITFSPAKAAWMAKAFQARPRLVSRCAPRNSMYRSSCRWIAGQGCRFPLWCWFHDGRQHDPRSGYARGDPQKRQDRSDHHASDPDQADCREEVSIKYAEEKLKFTHDTPSCRRRQQDGVFL